MLFFQPRLNILIFLPILILFLISILFLIFLMILPILIFCRLFFCSRKASALALVEEHTRLLDAKAGLGFPGIQFEAELGTTKHV